MPLDILPLFACSRRYGYLLVYTAYHTFAVPTTDFSADTVIHYITSSPIVVSICSVPLHIADTLRSLTISGKLFNQFFILLLIGSKRTKTNYTRQRINLFKAIFKDIPLTLAICFKTLRTLSLSSNLQSKYKDKPFL